MTIREIASLSSDEVRLLARDQADSGEPCAHPFEPGSREAIVFERAYQERVSQINPVDG